MAAKRGRTAFFLFSEEQREATRAECIEKADAPTKVSVATVAKAIGEKWRALSEEEKAAYKERAQAAAVPDPEDDRGNKGEEAEAGEDNADADADAQQQPDALHNSHPFGFPLSLVKRVMCMDPEVVRISGDGIKATAKATELLLELMAMQAIKVAQSNKRKTIKFTDVDRAVRTDRRLVDVGLKEVLSEDIFAEARGQGPLKDAGNRENAMEDASNTDAPAAAKAGSKGGGGRKKAKEDDKARQITEFFSR